MGKEFSNFIVEGMTCAHCEDIIKKSVGALNGVENVYVDLTIKKVSVEYDADRVCLQTIKGTIEDQGYDVR